MGQQNFVNSKTDGGEWQNHTAVHGLRVDLKFNSLNKKRVCLVHGLSAYRAVNTLRLVLKKQSVNVV